MMEKYFAEIEGVEYQIEILSDKRVVINGEPYEFDFQGGSSVERQPVLRPS